MLISGIASAQFAIWEDDFDDAEASDWTFLDADGDAITVTPTSVMQDEPVLGARSGNHAPDATLSPLEVRRERQGNPPKNGRVYHIGFAADDGMGGTCTGEVEVCVPHDMSDPTCVDDGPIYSSL